ncbi:unnamed protein product [Discula destructiva]
MPKPALNVDDQLMVDTRIRLWEDGKWTLLHPAEHELRRRTADDSDPVTESLAIIVSTAASTPVQSSTPATTSSPSTTAAPASSSPLPTFFDGGLSNNFTESSCPSFINSMIAAQEFQACYPISLLLPGSQSFYEAEKSLVSISSVLDHSCAANVTSCATYFAGVASNLTKSENCGNDYSLGNPTVNSAYLGLIAYQVVYSATCLKDDATQSYCFGNAVTNTTYGTEAYFYFLPLNSSLPGATQPMCGGCLQDTMSIYHVATANRQQPIADTYGDAATMVNEMCGSGFANTTLADAITTSGAVAPGRGRPPLLLLVTAALVAAASWLV